MQLDEDTAKNYVGVGMIIAGFILGIVSFAGAAFGSFWPSGGYADPSIGS